MMQQIQSMCGECHGEGERVDPKLRCVSPLPSLPLLPSLPRCKKCNGRKVNRERKILEVSVDKGMEDGQKVTFSGEGDQEPGLEPGDIIIVLDEKAHALFKRNGQVGNCCINFICILSFVSFFHHLYLGSVHQYFLAGPYHEDGHKFDRGANWFEEGCQDPGREDPCHSDCQR